MYRYLAALTLLTCTTTYAQDTIYYRQLPPNIVYVKHITPTKVSFTHINEQNGPIFHVHVRDLAKVVSAHGEILYYDAINWSKTQERNKGAVASADINIRKRFPRQVATLVPLAILSSDNLGTGLSYERMLDRYSTVGLRLPVFITFDRVSGYFMPSLRFYPFGQRVATVFISPGLFTAYGERRILRDSLRNVTGAYGPYQQELTEWQVGFYGDVGLNLYMNNNMLISLTLGGGLNYLDLTKDGDYIYSSFGKFEVGFGYRFGKEN
ncbi:MAG TPA: hypothetical protein VIN07_14880 [Flavipsychrobacter sp.]